jgi:hypothetical protein
MTDEHGALTDEDLDQLQDYAEDHVEDFGKGFPASQVLALMREVRRQREAPEEETPWMRCEACNHAILNHEVHAWPGRVTETGILCEACEAAQNHTKEEQKCKVCSRDFSDYNAWPRDGSPQRYCSWRHMVRDQLKLNDAKPSAGEQATAHQDHLDGYRDGYREAVEDAVQAARIAAVSEADKDNVEASIRQLAPDTAEPEDGPNHSMPNADKLKEKLETVWVVHTRPADRAEEFHQLAETAINALENKDELLRAERRGKTDTLAMLKRVEEERDNLRDLCQQFVNALFEEVAYHAGSLSITSCDYCGVVDADEHKDDCLFTVARVEHGIEPGGDA